MRVVNLTLTSNALGSIWFVQVANSVQLNHYASDSEFEVE